MKNVLKLFSIVLLLFMFIPKVDAATTITGDGTILFANGISITIDDEVPASGTLETLTGFTATGTSAYVIWTEDSTTKYVGVDRTATVYGGSNGTAEPTNVASSSITMTGGQIYHLYGGNLGANNTAKDGTLDTASKVTGNVTINVTGGSVTRIYGGGRYNAAVDGTVTINVSDVTFVPDTNAWSYLVGGVNGSGNEGIIDVNTRTISTNAIVNKVVMTVNNTSVKALTIGGGGHTKTNEGTLTIGDGIGTDDTTVSSVNSGGIHGYIGTGTVTINKDADIEDVSATNRGYIVNSKFIIKGGNIDNLYTGATPEAFSSDGNNASAINGKAEIVIDDASGITNAYITPSINKRTGETSYYEVHIPTLTLTNNDTTNLLDFKLADYTASSSIASLVNVKTYEIPESKTLSLNGNLKLTVPNGFTLTNNGTIVNNSTLVNSGTIDNTDGLINTGATGVTPTENIEGDTPKVALEGNNQTYDANDEEDKENGMVFEFSGTLGEDFTEDAGKVYVDGTLVDPDNYTITEGSVVVTLKPSYLNTLSNGNHVVKLMYDNESYAEATFTASNIVNPDTFDGIYTYIIITLIAMLVVGFAVTKIKKYN